MKYFAYSRTQHKELSIVTEKINKKFVPGKVYTAGVYKLYTEILSSPISRYSDAIIVLTIDDINLQSTNYTEATFEVR